MNDIHALLDRVRKGSIDAEHELFTEIERLRSELGRFHNLAFDIRSCDLRWVGDKPVLIYSGFATEDEAKAFHDARSRP